MKDLFYRGCALFTIAVIAMTTIPAAIAHTYAGAPAYHHWAVGEVVTAADLNNTFDHVHNTFSANIADAHISPTAAITHSKMKYPQLLPKAMVGVADPCTSGTCTTYMSSRITSVVWTGTGAYTVTLAYTAANTSYSAIVTAGQSAKVFCTVSTVSNTTFSVTCWNDTGAAANTGFTALVLDDDN